MTRKIFMIVGLYFVTLSLLTAQTNKFSAGRLLLPNGDSLRGELEYKNWSLNPRKIRFKSADGAVKEYSPLDIKGFSAKRNDGNEEHYESAVMEIDKSQNPKRIEMMQTNHTNSSKPVLVKDTMFLLVEIRGDISLYSLNESEKGEHFFVRKGGELLELTYLKYLQFLGNNASVTEKQQMTNIKTASHTVRENRTFITQLRELMADCPQMQDLNLYTSLKYNVKDLKKIVTSYNACKSTGNTYSLKKEKAKLFLTLGVGGAILSPVYNLSTTKITYQPRFGQCFLLGAAIMIPRTAQRTSVHIDYIYQANKSNVTIQNPTSAQQFEQTWNESLLSVAVRHQITLRAIRPYVGIGANFSLSRDVSQTDKLTAPSKSLFVPLAIIGVSYKKLSLEVRYERDWKDSITDSYTGFVSSYRMNRFQALLRYKIF